MVISYTFLGRVIRKCWLAAPLIPERRPVRPIPIPLSPEIIGRSAACQAWPLEMVQAVKRSLQSALMARNIDSTGWSVGRSVNSKNPI